MNNFNKLPNDFTGTVEQQTVITTIADDSKRVSSSSITHYVNGQLHREDGPAIEYSNGSRLWYLHGHQLTEDEFNYFLVKKTLDENLPSKPITKRGKI